MPNETTMTPEVETAAVRALAERMAQEKDVPVRDAEYAIRRMVALSLIKLEVVHAN